MKIKLLAALAALGMSGSALAYVDCKPGIPENYQPESLYAVPTKGVIRLLAGAKVSSTDEIGYAESNMAPITVTYVCQSDSIVLSRPFSDGGFDPYDGYPDMYRTNIEGIGVKFMVSNGVNSRPLPVPERPGYSDPGKPYIRVTLTPEKVYAYFYKLAPKVDLKGSINTQNTLMASRKIGEYRLEDVTFLKYYINNVYIVGIPTCKANEPLPVDFNTVNAKKVRDGEIRPFDFGITCLSDYGNYTAVASIKSLTITKDNKYIQVTDNKGDQESLIIEITDENNNPVMVDGSTKIKINDVESGKKATFNWKAKLKKQDGKPYPAQGPFKALATITLDIE
ncbi:fimbrial protein [Morganella morganii]|nr:fimbrial protein [Morganella morganii]